MQKITTKTDCVFIRKNLFSYREKQLSGEENQRFEDHLHSCPGCTRIVSDFQSVAVFIGNSKADKPDPFIQTRTIRRIETELERGRASSISFTRRFLQPALVACSLLFAMVAGFAIGKQIEPKFSGTPTRQQEIQTMKSDLYIPDFMNEENSFFANN